MGTYLYNALRLIMAVIFLAGLLAGLEISLYKEHANPLNWNHVAISAGIVGLVLACSWDRRNPPGR
jgi:uncharacterized membrane protein